MKCGRGLFCIIPAFISPHTPLIRVLTLDRAPPPAWGGVRVGVIAAKPTTLWGHKKVSLEIVGNCAMLILPGEWFPLAWFASWRCEMFRTLYLVPPDERRPGTRVESCRGQYVYEVKRRERKPTKHGEVRHYWVDPETGKWYNETLSAK